MELDIRNNEERKIRCVRNDKDVWERGENSHLLTVGQKYTIYAMNIWDWSTDVYLREFPGIPFNSVLFEEV